jgi:hypothetical protein
MVCSAMVLSRCKSVHSLQRLGKNYDPLNSANLKGKCIIIYYWYVPSDQRCPYPYSFSSVAHAWVHEVKTTGPIAKKFGFLQSNFYVQMYT